MRYLVGLPWIGGCVVGGGEQSFVFDGVTDLRIELASGSVDLTPSADTALRLDWDGGGIGQPARPEVTQDGSGAVSMFASGGLGGGDVTGLVPAGVPATVLLDNGDITVVLDEATDLDLCVGAGSIDLTVPPGAYRLELDLAVGAIDSEVVDDPSAPTTLRVCAGVGDLSVHAGS